MKLISTAREGGFGRWFVCVGFALLLAGFQAQAADSGTNAPPSPTLTLPRIFGGGEFNGESFSGRWLEAGGGYTTFESPTNSSGGRDLVRHDVVTGAREVLVPAADFVPKGESGPLSIEGHEWSKDRSRLLIYTRSKRVWRTNSRGDYWVLDRTARELRKLGGDAPASSLMFARFSPDGTRVAYVRDRNIYVEDVRTHEITALTRTSSPTVINGTFDWVYEEEFGLREGFRWSPDGTRIAYWQLDSEGLREVPLVDNVDGLYPKVQWIPYPKVGEVNSACRVGVVAATGGETRWVDVAGDPRNNYLFDLDWAETGGDLLLQQLNRLQNTNRILLADPTSGRTTLLALDRDDAWVDGHQNLKWVDGGKQLLFWSQRDGWRHLHTVARKGGKVRTLTSGDFDVIDLVHADPRQDWVYFTASPTNATQRYLYRVRTNGRSQERVTPSDQPGTHSYRVSPDGLYAFHTRSRFDEPPVTELVTLPDHKVVRVLVDNQKLKERLATLAQPKTEFFQVSLTNGIKIDAWAVRPPDFDPAKKYPLLVYVYGEPAGTTVTDSWGGKSHLWHAMLAQQGYIVMSFDNRGTSAPRGRAWQKVIYRQVGILAPTEQAGAVRAVLASQPSVDPERVGVWGWSGGGSMTLNALFKYPELYRAGISIASVPNQRFYDTIYQERYMGLPADNVDGFRNGSPIHFAHQLKGDLLLIHGTGDDNCHYQGAEALVDELIRHEKPFRLMAYPNRSHSISEGAGTTIHLRGLMTTFLHEKLPPGPR
jgi:dipeptidyl-peptidase-4